MKRVLLKVFSYLAFCTLTVLVSGEEVANDPYAKLASKIKPIGCNHFKYRQRGKTMGVGTGFIVRSDGIIATNFHVIGERREFSVELADGTLCKPTEILAIDKDSILLCFVSTGLTFQLLR